MSATAAEDISKLQVVCSLFSPTAVEGIPQDIETARYHSLLVERDSFPDCLEIAAETEAGEIMACHHREFPVWGLQFHPESIATQNGMDLLKNFLSL